jgi:predicted dehydrogenase
MLVREMGPRYMVNGQLGSYIKSGDDPQEELLKKGVLPTSQDWGKEPDDIAGLLHTEVDGEIIRKHIPSEKGNFGLYYDRLYQSILGKGPLFEKPEHGYNVIRIIELAQQSHAEKRTVDCTNLIKVTYD